MTPSPSDRRSERGPFDVIGDVHGCRRELEALLDRLGYVEDDAAGRRHPAGRRVVFLGDLVDRGPDVVGVLRLAMRMAFAGSALCVLGNHEQRMYRRLRGRPEHQRDLLSEVAAFLAGLQPRYVLDEGRLVVTHGDRPLVGEGDAIVVYGHAHVAEAVWRARTICIDTGCVYGGRLTALRYPELTLESVAALPPAAA